MKPHDFDEQVDLSHLRHHAAPTELQQRVLGTLAERGLVRRPTTWLKHFATLAAAAAALLVIGFALGSRRSNADTDMHPQYALLLYDDTLATTHPAARDSIVAEYRRWSASLLERGQLVLGEELGREVVSVPDSGTGLSEERDRYQLGGLFIIRAATLVDAVNLARETPHARGAGIVMVRPITTSDATSATGERERTS